MAYDAFMQLQDIPGESTAQGFEKTIEILSFSWSASAPVTVGAGTGGISASRVSISSFHVTKRMDIASTKLFQACCLGTHIDTLKVSLRKQTGQGGQQPYLIYEFSEVLVESIHTGGNMGGDDRPVEQISFVFGKMQEEYRSQDARGKLVAGTPVQWDLTTVSDQ